MHGAKEDKSTGETPRKRSWDYVDKWERTKNRDVVLRAWREQRTPKGSSRVSVAENLPPSTEGGGVGEDTEI